VTQFALPLNRLFSPRGHEQPVHSFREHSSHNPLDRRYREGYIPLLRHRSKELLLTLLLIVMAGLPAARAALGAGSQNQASGDRAKRSHPIKVSGGSRTSDENNETP